MKHVFVETNWVFEYCAPAYRSTRESQELAERAANGEITLYVPAVSLREGVDAIRQKCQPRAHKELLEFRRWAFGKGKLSAPTHAEALTFLDVYEKSVKADLAVLDSRVDEIKKLPGVEVFALNQRMLDRAIELRAEVATLKPFDEAILAAILVMANDLSGKGQKELYFCELDGDLLPFDKKGKPRKQLKELYARTGIVVCKGFIIP